MLKHTARLADGREIIFYDETQQFRHVHDTRDIAPAATPTELRFDPILDEWVAVASSRADRTHLPSTNDCPLCPTRADHATEIPTSDYHVVVFENRFPSFQDNATTQAHSTDELHQRRPGAGRCEVVCFTPDHHTSFSSLTPERARVVVDAWADRTTELSGLPAVEQVFCFENRGEAIGVTLHHPHGQIYAYPFVTPRTRRMLDSARRYQERTSRNLFADVLEAERADGTRVVAKSDYWTAFVPTAARWPVEVHLYPNRQVPDLPALSEAERDDFAHIYLDLLKRFDRLFDTPLPYIAAWHQAPVRADRDLAYLHLQVFSIQRAANKLKFLAGSESGMGVFVNDIAPEATAQRLREA
jgi:UDPglucose--hexose-1-phosphate uridylyltransferase